MEYHVKFDQKAFIECTGMRIRTIFEREWWAKMYTRILEKGVKYTFWILNKKLRINLESLDEMIRIRRGETID